MSTGLPEAKFKPGDRVVCVGAEPQDPYGRWFYHGLRGKILFPTPSYAGGIVYMIQLDNHTSMESFLESNLMLELEFDFLESLKRV